jgi:prolyl-tRNA synthetase
MFVAYLRTFARLGLKAIPMEAETGPIGGNLSHEFIILAERGESAVFCHKGYLEFDAIGSDIDYDSRADLQAIVDRFTSLYAATDDKLDPARFDQIPADKRISTRGIEVGHIFYFGEKYSKPLGALVTRPDGQQVPVHMGSYGVGVSRLVGAIIEASHDQAGIIWPAPVAPFGAGLINLKPTDAACAKAGEDLYAKLIKAGLDPLYDERDERAGAKFADMDLIGLPWQIVIGPRGVGSGQVELKNRATGEKAELGVDAAIARIKG